ncbi:Transcription initiation factor TFIID subunit 1 [Dendrobium catenatum]|uniref:Transcription initiation factor TFIID subunit 1 n=1 Tax=Dendrobium catenatum TaxID=906689 RepID=A0A2I0XC27_9ASPA|nr:Transcription initiation factor TFIID subunit 1 [Dendrobium catenatum]
MDEAASHDGREEEDEEEYEEVGGGGRLLGFMFGNVDYSGDLDVDYLDEDAKEHLSALADKLGPSLTDMDLIKSSPATTDASEQDFYEKAEDAVDYEDIDEQYDGPEVQAATEEDHLLPRKEYFSSDAFLSSLNSKASIFDEEDYDEDDDMGKDSKIKEKIDEVEGLSLAGGDLEVASAKSLSLDDDMPSRVSLEIEEVALEPAVFQEDEAVLEEQVNSKCESALPVLCVEDGLVILRFSEIFGVHEPLKRPDRRNCQKRPSCNGRFSDGDIRSWKVYQRRGC